MVGAASILAGVLYTGGPRPYGYEGLGELFVFVFFGIVAVVGSYFVQTEELRWEAFALAVPVGLLASAILVVNNVRDIDTDRRAGKRTLAVKLGRDRARLLFTAMVVGAFAAPAATWAFGGLSAWLLLTLAALPLAPPLIETVSTRSDGPALNGALAGHRPAAGRLLGAAGRRRAAAREAHAAAALDPAARAVRDRGRRGQRARARGAAARGRPTGRWAGARPLRSSPTTASRSSARSPRSAAAADGGRRRRARPRSWRGSTSRRARRTGRWPSRCATRCR